MTRLYILINDDLQSPNYKDIIAVYLDQALADKTQSELVEGNGEKVRMLIVDTED